MSTKGGYTAPVSESETPEVDAVLTAPDGAEIIVHGLTIEALAAVARSLERRLSLAQTEIKGHMRVEDELKATIHDLSEENKTLHSEGILLHATEAAIKQTKRAEAAEARIAELEKDATRLEAILAIWKAHRVRPGRTRP